MSKSTVIRVSNYDASLSVIWMLGRRESAQAEQLPQVASTWLDSGMADAAECPCFNLEALESVQWSVQAADGPNCKAGSPLWSIASPPTGIVNAASVHTDLSTCVLVIEFGPAAGAFRADLNLSADEQQRCIEIIEAAQRGLDCLP